MQNYNETCEKKDWDFSFGYASALLDILELPVINREVIERMHMESEKANLYLLFD